MISSVIDGTERALGKAIVWLFGIIILSLFLLVGLSFLGYALFLLMQHWMAPIYSAMFTAGVFIIGGVLCITIIKHCLTPRSNASNNVKKSEHQIKTQLKIKNNPGISLSLALTAGFLFESDPRIKEQLSKILVTLLDQSISDLSSNAENDDQV